MSEPRRRRRSGDEPPGGLPLLPADRFGDSSGPALRRRARSLLWPIQLANLAGGVERNGYACAFPDSQTSVGGAVGDSELDTSVAHRKNDAFAVTCTFVDADADEPKPSPSATIAPTGKETAPAATPTPVTTPTPTVTHTPAAAHTPAASHAPAATNAPAPPPSETQAVGIVRSYLSALARGDRAGAASYLAHGSPSESFVNSSSHVDSVRVATVGAQQYQVTAAVQSGGSEYYVTFTVGPGANGLAYYRPLHGKAALNQKTLNVWSRLRRRDR